MKNMFRNSAPDNHNLTRRKLLRSATLILALVTTSTRGLFARPQADDGGAAEEHLQQTLVRLARLLFPHGALPSGPYEDIAKALVSRAATDADFAESLQAGVAELDAGNPSPWSGRVAA